MNMIINAFNPSNNISIKPYQIAFGTSHRVYSNQSGDDIGTNTWLFRDDVEWKRLAKYEKQHFKNKDKVNIVQFAASDGSEAYTKIMSILENNPSTDDSKFFPIKAYDIDPEIVKAAKSGYLNTIVYDRMNLQMNTDDYTQYFEPFDNVKKKLDILNDKTNTNGLKALKVTDTLKKNVEFNQADMYKMLMKLKDESNTILMCRNILGYFDNNEVELFVKLVSIKLKPDSLFIIGDHDTKHSFIRRYLEENKFIEVMKNVYKKIH